MTVTLLEPRLPQEQEPLLYFLKVKNAVRIEATVDQEGQ